MTYYRKMTGERLYLAPINAADADSYVKWMNDPYVATNFAQYPQLVSSKQDLRWIFEPPDDMHRYAIVLLDGDILIGSISLHNISHRNRNAFIGIFLGEEEHRGKGYGAEAIRLILRYGFETQNLHNIMLSVQADNAAAIACYKKVGFREAGRRREWMFKAGKYVDMVFMDILESEFNTNPQ
jgi:RimJ/RimL family protein N-acetyltransferase